MITVGLTFDLADDQILDSDLPEDYYAEFDSYETIDQLTRSIEAAGFKVDKIGNIFDLVERLSQKSLGMPDNWDIVFNFAEGIHGRARESQIPALLEAYRIPYVGSDALTLSVTLDKAITKDIWKQKNLPVTEHVIWRKDDTDVNALDQMSLPVFVKPLREGSSKGISADSVVYDATALKTRVEWLSERYKQEVIVEPYLTGQELTVGLIGNGENAEIINVLVIKDDYSDYKTKKNWNESTFVELQDSQLRDIVSDIALKAYRTIQCVDFARIDMRCDEENKPYLLEINPLPGLRPGQSALPIMAQMNGMTYTDLVQSVLARAMQRLGIT